MKTIYLQKENNDLISHCKCENALTSYPSQLDCPWCGCGWLFSCIECRKAFTFAKGIETDLSLEELAEEDYFGFYNEKPSKEDVDEWVEGMKAFLSDIEVGKSYIYFDGSILPADSTDFEFTGWFSHHKFDKTPQMMALKKPNIVDKILCNSDYWIQNEIENRE
jgi:hypothetical protein